MLAQRENSKCQTEIQVSAWCSVFPCVHFLLTPFSAGFPDLRECEDPELLSGPVHIAGTFEAQPLQTVTELCEQNNEKQNYYLVTN